VSAKKNHWRRMSKDKIQSIFVKKAFYPEEQKKRGKQQKSK
jgi:hypothetical protein